MSHKVTIDVIYDEPSYEYDPIDLDIADEDDLDAQGVVDELKQDSKRSVIQDLDLLNPDDVTLHITVTDEVTGKRSRAVW